MVNPKRTIITAIVGAAVVAATDTEGDGTVTDAVALGTGTHVDPITDTAGVADATKEELDA